MKHLSFLVIDLMLDVFPTESIKTEVPKFVHYLVPQIVCWKDKAVWKVPWLGHLEELILFSGKSSFVLHCPFGL